MKTNKDFAEAENYVLLVGVTTSCVLTLGGVIVLVGSICFFRKAHFAFWRLIMALSLADSGFALSIIIGTISKLSGYSYSGGVCIAQGFFIEFFELTSNTYVLMISIMLCMVVIFKAQIAWYTELLLHLIPWLLGLFLATVPLWQLSDLVYTDQLVGNYAIHFSVSTSSWCWVRASPAYAWFVMSYIWTWLVMGSVLILYSLMGFVIRKERERSKWESKRTLAEVATGTSRKQQITRDLFIYPLAFVLLWIPNTVNCIVEIFVEPIYALVLLESVCLPLQGFLDAVVFGTTMFLHSRERVSRILYVSENVPLNAEVATL